MCASENLITAQCIAGSVAFSQNNEPHSAKYKFNTVFSLLCQVTCTNRMFSSPRHNQYAFPCQLDGC